MQSQEEGRRNMKKEEYEEERMWRREIITL